MTTQYLAEADMLWWLAHPAVDVQLVDEFVPHQCEWCGEAGAVATARVYGRPGCDVLSPVELVEVCGMCAPAVVRDAVAERAAADDEPITVEVAA
jgi:hypothetical protein